MLRYLTAGESHGKALLALVDGFPAGVTIERRRDRRRTAPPPGRLRPRRPAADRNRPRRNPQRRLARHHPGQPHRPADPQQGLQDRPDGGPDPAPARPRRPERRDQVSDLGPGDPGTGQRPGDDRPRGRRRAWPSNCSPRWASRPSPTWSQVGPLAIQPQPGTLDEQRACRDRQHPVYAQSRSGRRGQGVDRPLPGRPATRWAASSRSASRACPTAWARTPNGTASSTAGWPRR